MESNTINAQQLAYAFIAGANNLEAKKEWINELNVFPVPDGDTGSNMSMTIMSAAQAVYELEDPDMMSVSKAISSGSLRGARGNSGVILSQLFRGFTKVVKKEEEINVDIMCEAMQKAVETAYKAVMKPKEGTILTVARGAADKALEMADITDDMEEFISACIAEAEAVLAKTPDMLPVLKQAGVVDSGGQGLVEVLKGAFDYLQGKDVKLTVGDGSKSEKKEEVKVELKYCYDTEFNINTTKKVSDKKIAGYSSYLETIGDTVRVLAMDDLIKVHVHTNDPGLAVTEGLKYGSLTNISIDNMAEEQSAKHEEEAKAETKTQVKETKAEAKAEPQAEKEIGFVAVSVGEGMNQIFKELGCDYIIEGGQTMNPSAGDVLAAVEQVNAKTVFVAPNNKNIILAAEQAAKMIEGKKIVVLPTKTVPQGITALINLIPDQTVEENEARMIEELSRVKTGQVTYAVRDTVIDDKEITEGDYMGIGDAGILAVNADMDTTLISMLQEMVDDESAIITIYYGQEVKESEALALAKKVEAEFKDLEVEVQEGSQPVYYYITSVE